MRTRFVRGVTLAQQADRDQAAGAHGTDKAGKKKPKPQKVEPRYNGEGWPDCACGNRVGTIGYRHLERIVCFSCAERIVNG